VQMIERYQIFLALAFVALVAAQLIPDRIRERMPARQTRPWRRNAGNQSPA